MEAYKMHMIKNGILDWMCVCLVPRDRHISRSFHKEVLYKFI